MEINAAENESTTNALETVSRNRWTEQSNP